MVIRSSLLGSLMLVSTLALAEESPDCGNAVDAADRLAPSFDEHCDYTKTGLNGALHKAFSGKTTEASLGAASSATARFEPKAELAPLVAKGEFSSAPQLQTLKFSLLETAGLKCQQGFTLLAEQYFPAPSRAMTLVLTYRCI